jgi:hypothetical protein
VQRLEHRDVVALLHQVARHGQRGGAAADARHLLPGRGGARRQAELARVGLPVGDETLQVADRERVELLPHHAGALALVLLRADAPGHGGQHVVLAHLGGSGLVVSLLHQLDELAHLDADGTALDALGVGARDAARSLGGRDVGG